MALKDEDPHLYAYHFKDGVEMAESGASSPHTLFDVLVRDDCKEARIDGYLARIAHGTADKK